VPNIVLRLTGEEIEVSEHEESVLRAQDLVVDTKATTPEGRRRAAERMSAGLAADADDPDGQQPGGNDDSQEG
jgi:hypothetical protein